LPDVIRKELKFTRTAKKRRIIALLGSSFAPDPFLKKLINGTNSSLAIAFTSKWKIDQT
jgi:hypothetical protein